MPVSLSRSQFDQLLRPIRPALLRLALHRVGPNAAEGRVQEGLVQAWQAICRFNPDTGSAGLATFCRRYVVYACRDYLRRHLRPGEVLLPPEEVLKAAECGVTPDLTSLAYDALRHTFYALLDRIALTALQEQCLRLWLDGLTQTQIAHYLQIGQSAVSRHIAAGAVRLRDAYHWEQEVIEPEVLHFFWEVTREQSLSVYHRPSGVWDRSGNVEDRLRRARLWTWADERERGKHRRKG